MLGEIFDERHYGNEKEQGPQCGHGADLCRSARMGREPGLLLRLRREAGGQQGSRTAAPVLPGARRAPLQVLAAVLRGEASRQDIPVAARANLARIKFIQSDREIQKAFANPGQQVIRRRKSQP
jgi:hypothetical protein